MPTMPTLKRHLCGHRILSVLPLSLTRHSLILWYDGEQGSPTFKREIRQCPGCGKKLTLASLVETGT
jgi:hypothetical protein